MNKIVKYSDGVEFLELWNTFLEKENPDCGVRFPWVVREYFKLLSGSRFVSDESFIVVKNGKPVAISPLFLEKIDGKLQFSQFSESLPLPAFSHSLNLGEKKKVILETYRYIESLCREKLVQQALFIENPLEKMRVPFSMSYPEKHGWHGTSFFTSVIDLTENLEHLKSDIRHSYRALINKVLKTCEFKLFDKNNFTREVGENYREMHRKAAGRVTRPIETFQKIYEWVEQGSAFIIEQSHEGKPVCYVVIMRAGDHLYYASLADDPEASKDSGMMHGWVWFAIERFAQMKFKTLEMGHLIFGAKFGRPVSAKLAGISRFKSGYGGLEVPISEYSWFSNVDEAKQWIDRSYEQYFEYTKSFSFDSAKSERNE